jgi:hypothetical protein
MPAFLWMLCGVVGITLRVHYSKKNITLLDCFVYFLWIFTGPFILAITIAEHGKETVIEKEPKEKKDKKDKGDK